MRKPPFTILLVVATVAGCGGAGAATYSRAQASALVKRCLTSAGARRVQAAGRGGRASFGKAGEIRWGYVMSAGKVADVFSTGSLAAPARAKADACLEPYGWHIG